MSSQMIEPWREGNPHTARNAAIQHLNDSTTDASVKAPVQFVAVPSIKPIARPFTCPPLSAPVDRDFTQPTWERKLTGTAYGPFDTYEEAYHFAFDRLYSGFTIAIVPGNGTQCLYANSIERDFILHTFREYDIQPPGLRVWPSKGILLVGRGPRFEAYADQGLVIASSDPQTAFPIPLWHADEEPIGTRWPSVTIGPTRTLRDGRCVPTTWEDALPHDDLGPLVEALRERKEAWPTLRGAA
jgi:hypothetical protein